MRRAAWIAAVLAACGDEGMLGPDADQRPDAAPDAPFVRFDMDVLVSER